MLKKRLSLLAVLLCSLAFVASEPASAAGSWCSCAATSCTTCQATCYPDPGTSDAEVEAAAVSCCEQAWRDTGPAMACPPRVGQ